VATSSARLRRVIGYDITDSGNTFTIAATFAASNTLTKLGSGTLALSGVSGTIGLININAIGTLDVVNTALTVTPATAGGNAVQSTTGGIINGNGTGTITLTQNSATDGGNVGTAAGTTLTINAQIIGTNAFELAGGSATGVVVLTNDNTYTGNTLINTGILSVAKVGSSGSTTSNLGTAGTIAITTDAILRYTGTGESSNRAITLSATTTGGILDMSGTGTLTFSANFGTPGAGARVLTLTGSTAGGGVISGIINQGSTTNTTGVTKTGTGTWSLSGANTYTGATTISAGTLVISGGSLANTAVSIANGLRSRSWAAGPSVTRPPLLPVAR